MYILYYKKYETVYIHTYMYIYSFTDVILIKYYLKRDSLINTNSRIYIHI